MMKKISVVIIAALIIVLMTAGLFKSNSIKYNGKKYKSGDKIIITGYVARIGSARFVQFVIIDDKGIRFSLPADFVEKEGVAEKTITLKGILNLKEITTLKEKKKVIIKEVTPVDYDVVPAADKHEDTSDDQ